MWHEGLKPCDDLLSAFLKPVHFEALVVKAIDRILVTPFAAIFLQQTFQFCEAVSDVLEQYRFFFLLLLLGPVYMTHSPRSPRMARPSFHRGEQMCTGYLFA